MNCVKRIIFVFLFLAPILTKAQMLVYTVAGNDTVTAIGDGRPATVAQIGSDEGIWIDGHCNIYISDLGYRRIRKITSATGIITTIAGTGINGYSGDGGPATNAEISNYGLYTDVIGNVYFADPNSNRVRKIDASTGTINTYAGGGTILGDGEPATNAQLDDPLNVYGDEAGNIYISENGGRIRKINATGIITTIAGNGIRGYSGDGGPATNAQIAGPSGMLFDTAGNFYFADRSNSIIRKINRAGIITTFAGTPGVFDYSGDGGPATAAKLSGPISFVIDYMGNMIIGDNQNDCMRKVDAYTHIITTIAGVGTSIVGSFAEGAPATTTDMHPEFMYLDRSGNIYYSCYCNKVRKVTHYYPGELYGANDCGETGVPQVPQVIDKLILYPNPAGDMLYIKTSPGLSTGGEVTITNSIGQVMMQQHITQAETDVPVRGLPPGMYFVMYKGEQGVEVERFVKE